MKKTINIGGQDLDLVTKTGLVDKEGKCIIPKEYDRLVKVGPHVVAAIQDREGSGEPSFEGVVDKGNLRFEGMIRSWRSHSYLEKVFASNIDFYSINGKLKLEKKVVAYYYSNNNGHLVLLDENLKWSIGVINYHSQEIQITYRPESLKADFDKKEVCILERDENIDRIKETEDGKLLLQKNGLYEFIFNGGLSRIGPFKYKAVEPYKNGFVAVLDNNRHGYIDYDGSVILDFTWEDITPKDSYIEVVSNVKPDGGKARGIYSYTGYLIVPCDYLRINHYFVLESELFVAKSVGIEGNMWYEIYSKKGRISSQYYSYVDIRQNGRMIYCSGGKYGMSLYDPCKNGFIELIPCAFENMSFFTNDSMVAVRKGDKIGLYDINGTQVRRFKYESFIPKEERDLYSL